MSERPKFVPEHHPRESSRRDVLRILGAALVTGAVEANLPGCTVASIGLRDDEIHHGMERLGRKIEDPDRLLRFLHNREIVIKNEIMDAYIATIDKF